MQRGDFVLAAVPGDYGKPRPALIVQSSLYDGLPSVALCPLTSDLRDDAPYCGCLLSQTVKTVF